MAIEIVDFPMKDDDFPIFSIAMLVLPEGIDHIPYEQLTGRLWSCRSFAGGCGVQGPQIPRGFLRVPWEANNMSLRIFTSKDLL